MEEDASLLRRSLFWSMCMRKALGGQIPKCLVIWEGVLPGRVPSYPYGVQTRGLALGGP